VLRPILSFRASQPTTTPTIGTIYVTRTARTLPMLSISQKKATAVSLLIPLPLAMTLPAPVS
jgi:hypothetical protein